MNTENGEQKKEHEQTPEEIRNILENAAEGALKAELTVLKVTGGASDVSVVIPYCFSGEYLAVETEDGQPCEIEIGRVVRARILDDEEANE